jgi:hypothetical protein
MEGNVLPGSARERMADPRAGTAARFRLSGLPSGKAPSVQRGGRCVTKAGTFVKMRPRKGDETCALSSLAHGAATTLSDTFHPVRATDPRRRGHSLARDANRFVPYPLRPSVFHNAICCGVPDGLT